MLEDQTVISTHPHDLILTRDQVGPKVDLRLANSFKNFLYKVWKSFGFGAPSKSQYAMADHLQYEGDRVQLICFRGLGKSWVGGAFDAWVLYRDPREQVVSLSATGGFAESNSKFTFSLIMNFPWLAHMRPTHEQASSGSDWDVRDAPPQKGNSFSSRSITGQITGLRSSTAVLDDTETPNTSSTPGEREKLRRRTSEVGGAINKPGGKIVYIGTAQHEETVYLENEEKGYVTLIIPALYPSEKEVKRLGAHRLAKFILEDLKNDPSLAGTPTEPKRFTSADLAKRRLEFGPVEFDRQFMMFMDGDVGKTPPLLLRNLPVMELTPWDPMVEGSGVPISLTPPALADEPLDLDRLGISIDALSSDKELRTPSVVGTFVKPDETICYVDTSGDGADETTWTILALKSGRIFMLDQNSALDGYGKRTLEAIAASVKRWGATTTYIESNLGMGMFATLLRPVFTKAEVNCAIETPVVGRQSKEKRMIGALEPVTTSKLLIVNLEILRKDNESSRYEGVEETKRRFYRFCYQYTRLKRGKKTLPHDDRIDSLAGGVSIFQDRLEVIAEEAEKDAHTEYLRREMERLHEINPPRKTLVKPDLVAQAYGSGDEDMFKGKRESGRYS